MQQNPPAAPAVRDSLGRVLRSEAFARSDRARKLLTYLIEREQAGEADRLKGFTIAMDVFGKDADFDPSTDAVVRVQAGRLRELLSQYYAGEGAAEGLRIAIPRGGYVPSYNMVAKGGDAIGPAPAAESPSVTPAPPADSIVIGQVRLFWAAMAAVIAMLAFIIYRTVLPGAEIAGDTVAVAAESSLATAAINIEVPAEAIPTAFITAEKDNSEPARVAAKFRIALAGFDTVDLIGRDPGDDNAPLNFSFDFSDGPVPGSVMVEVGNVGTGRVLLNRILNPDDLTPAHIDDRMADMLSSVVPVSGVIYGFLENAEVKSELVTCLLLNDNYYLDPGPATHRVAYECLEKLIAADAKSPLVYSELASLHLEAFTDNYDYPPDASADQALSFAMRAVKMGPTSPYAHRSLGYILSRTGKRVESIKWMKKAYELNTYDLGMAASYAYALIFSGEYREGGPIMQRAVEAASAHPSWWDYGLFLASFMRDDMQGAAAATDALAATKRSHYLAARLIAARFEGDQPSAGALAAEIAKSYPKFAADPRSTFEGANYPADLTDRLVDALKAAGLGGAS